MFYDWDPNRLTQIVSILIWKIYDCSINAINSRMSFYSNIGLERHNSECLKLPLYKDRLLQGHGWFLAISGIRACLRRLLIHSKRHATDYSLHCNISLYKDLGLLRHCSSESVFTIWLLQKYEPGQAKNGST